MSPRTKVLVALVLPQVAAFYVVRRLVRELRDEAGERIEGLMDGLELAVLDEMASWERAGQGYVEPLDEGWGPREAP